MEGEHYVIVDLLTLIPGNSSPTQASEIEVVGREFAISIQPEQPSLARQDTGVAPRASKEVNRGNRPKRLPFKKKGSHPAPMSRPESRSDPIGGSEPVSGMRDSRLGLFFFFF